MDIADKNNRHIGRAARLDFFLRAPEQHRIAALETHDGLVALRGPHEQAPVLRG